MKQIRIRSIKNGTSSPWIYIQEQVNKEKSKPAVTPMRMAAVEKKSKTNQYGRFRYNEMQYGIIERLALSSIEISKTPIRIRGLNGEWIYFQQMSFDGASPSIRIRNRNNEKTGSWVYTQIGEV
ncbi:hypothetical protein ABFV99_13085 [Cytobacillus horneckiae]|uniref:hypothetical protein n=1 Tax=Cytobacillus horneckiae TaxID=549687 RepID=UPI0034CFBC67